MVCAAFSDTISGMERVGLILSCVSQGRRPAQ